jgi:hypothetical protein
MSLFKNMFGSLFGSGPVSSEPAVGIDANGNPYGVTEIEPIDTSSCFDDSFSSGIDDSFDCSFDDSFSNSMDDW